ncbi:MAG: phosphotransferase [Gammaproteobacteria bacterium]|nr:phosphotransferase [Gammaproteobacteria bacterium]
MGLIAAHERAAFAQLAGGVSSDIWRVDARIGTLCVKRALPRLRVAAEWTAPVERNAYEAAWYRIAAAVVPGAVPEVLGEDEGTRAFAMRFLDPATHPVWKHLLRDGVADPATAAAVGERMGRVHAATAGDADIARRFRTDRIFHALRLEPYLLATARVHPGCADALRGLARATAANRRALVHGDISPKNILVGPQGPVFLDAECAWYGDPAFDGAFCLNHLLLKCLWQRRAVSGFLDCFEALAAAWLAWVDWEPRAALEARTARLLPGLLLARVDGKSPVEYLTGERDVAHVRTVARELLMRAPSRLAGVRERWASSLEA